MKSLLKKIYFTPIGYLLSRTLNPMIRKLKSPKMLWGYHDTRGGWRPRTRISDTVFFNHPERIRIEDNVFIGHYSILDGTGGLSIETGAQLAAWNGIYTHSSHIAIRIYGPHYQEVPEYDKVDFHISPVKIGRYVFIGAGAKILPGVQIEDGALISAGAVVTKKVDAFSIVAGNPAVVTGDTRQMDEEFLRKDKQLQTWYDEWQQNKE